MAQYDAPDLLARLQAILKRPSTDEDLTTAQAYIWLEEAQTYWMGILAAHMPELNYGAPELMTTSDNKVYSVASYPLGHMEIRASRTGELLIPGPEWSETADYTPEGQSIRIPGNRTRVFSSGPYARYVAMPGLLNASNAPTLKPAFARLLLVPRAAYLFCTAGGHRDPSPYLLMEQKLWSGDPSVAGDVGVLGMLKTQTFAAGMAAAMTDNSGAWWRNSPDLT